MTLGQLQLMKRTAWLNMQRERRTATDEEAAALTGYVVNAVVYTAVLNGILYDFAKALKADKVRPCGERAVIKRLHDAARYAHDEIYKVFTNAIDGFGELYNKRYDAVSEAIDQRIHLEGGEKYYNIVLSLLRLIIKNNTACGRYRSPALTALEPFIRRLKEVPLPYTDKGDIIDLIVDQASKSVMRMNDFETIINDYENGTK